MTYTDQAGREETPTLRLISLDPDENTFRAVRKVRLRDNQHHRRLDVVLYVNGLPLAVVELKQAGNKHATIANAHAQLGTCLHEFPMAARTVVASVISDGLSAQYGTPFTPLNHYSPWTVDEEANRSRSTPRIRNWRPSRSACSTRSTSSTSPPTTPPSTPPTPA